MIIKEKLGKQEAFHTQEDDNCLKPYHYVFFSKKGFDFDDNTLLGGAFKYTYFFNPIPGDMIQFD